MAGRIILGTANPSLDANGAPVAGSTLTFYQNKTTTLVSVYSAIDLLTPLANPLTCDASGEFPLIWAQDGVPLSVKWSRPGLASITYDDIYPSALPGNNYFRLVDVVATTNIAVTTGGMANGQTIDGQVLATGMRVLLTAQGTGSQNGIYDVPVAGAASRSSDSNSAATIPNGVTIVPQRGTLKDTYWVHTTAVGFILGTTALTFAQANTILSDSVFRISDNGDPTKLLAFEVSGITTGTTRTITVPDANITLARTDAAQTFTGTQTFSGTVDVAGGAKADTLTPHTAGGRVSVSSGVAAGAVIADFKGNDTTFAASICDMDAGGANNAGTAFQIQKVSSTGRSMSAAGTINASGADYAEYETKAAKCGDIAKGQIVGFDADGKLTDKFSSAISFGIKSTDPSYVGGDVWGNEEALGIGKPQHPGGEPEKADDENDDEFAQRAEAYGEAVEEFDAKMEALNAALEVARVKVDRVAYCGKVPVNVTGARPGDYIIAAAGDKDSIIGQIVSGTPTLDQYLKAVGRVRRILPDGRATVAVIVQ